MILMNVITDQIEKDLGLADLAAHEDDGLDFGIAGRVHRLAKVGSPCGAPLSRLGATLRAEDSVAVRPLAEF